jgi:Spherulation-specific family 4
LRIGVPAYFDPVLDPVAWRRLCEAAPTVGLVVANPHNGPGTDQLHAYVDAIEHAHQVGIVVLGYVHVSYGGRDVAEVVADVERWYAWYAVGGIFVDEVGASPEHETYNAAVTATIRRRQPDGHLLVFNPGMPSTPELLTHCDVVLNWEGSWPTYRDLTPSPDQNIAVDRVWHVVHGCKTATAMQAAVRLAASRGVGWLFVTPGSGANPYAALPPARYWMKEMDSVLRST